MNPRTTSICRETNETKISLDLNLDGNGATDVSTGLGFLDHMLTTLSLHAGWDLQLAASGDLNVDDHHTVEDCGIVIGSALLELAADKSGLCRFASKYAPLDEALARCVVDLSGRPCAIIDLGLQRDTIGQVACENLEHFFISLANAAKITMHLDVLRGENDHHRAEASFKASALAFKEAFAIKANSAIPSTKGTLTA